MRLILASALTLCLGLTMSCTPRTQGSASPCSDPMAVVTAFYDSNDAGHFDASMKYVADDIAFASWASGVQGYIMVPRHLKGKQQLRKFLPQGRGLGRRLPDSPPDGPIYHVTRVHVSGEVAKFMLEPDRIRPNGRPYNPFSVEAVLDGCRITSLTIIEQVTWL